MNKFFHLVIRFVLVLTVIFIAAQICNGLCKITQKCSPFYFSYYLPGEEESDLYKVVFGINNPRPNLEFEPLKPEITTVANRNNKITYRVKNNSDYAINFRIKLNVDPERIKNALLIYQCLCDSSYKLEKGEERILEMKFKIKGSGKKAGKKDQRQDDGKRNAGIKMDSEKEMPVLKIVYEVL
jgi:cytochrome c oxidase assembly protein Cox11